MNSKAKKKVLFVTSYFPPHPGGVEKFVFNIAEQLSQNHNWQVVVVTSAEDGVRKIETTDGIKIYRLHYQLKLSNSPLSLSWFWRLRKIIREENPDILNIQLPVPGMGDIAGLRAGNRPVVVTYHMASMKKESSPLNFIVAIYENVALPPLLRKAKRLISASDYVRDGFLAAYKHKTQTITPAVDVKLFHPATSRVTAPRILFVGSLNQSEKHKGLSYLLTACQKLHTSVADVHLTVVGSGDGLAEYQRLVTTMGLENIVDFRGVLHGDELAEAYRSAAVFTLPSTNDNFPLVIAEAMATGLPVVSTQIGGIPTLVDEGVTGLLVPPRDTDALAAALQQILTNPDLAQHLGEAGRRKAVNQLTWSRQANVTDQLFVEVLKRET